MKLVCGLGANGVVKNRCPLRVVTQSGSDRRVASRSVPFAAWQQSALKHAHSTVGS